MLDWLIIGGGVQGTYLSHVLTSRLGVSCDAIRVLDPNPNPLHRWQQTTDSCGMQFLRSPAAHHIGLRTNGLLDFARERYPGWREMFLEPYLRPSLALWNEHANWVIRENALPDMRCHATVQSVTRSPAAFDVQTDSESIRAHRLIIAVGNSQGLEYPCLSADSVRSGNRVRHVFDPQFARTGIADGEDVLIVGSGVTAAQLALSLTSRRDGKVTILTNRLPFITWFDSAPGWNGPRLLSVLAAIGDPEQRLAIVSAARIKGSFPGDTAAALLAAMHSGNVEMRVAELRAVHEEAGRVRLDLEADGQKSIYVDRLVYATGFSREIPAAELLISLQSQLSLPVSTAGWPVVNGNCEWGDGLYLAGALAQLELGPVSRNISGIRTFARRLVQLFSD